MKINRIEKENSVIGNYVAQLRDINIQNDQPKFRRNVQRIGMFMAYEISKTLNFEDLMVKTPLGESKNSVIKDELVLTTILRAGLPFHQGFLDVFDHVENAFIAAFRDYNKDHTQFKIVTEYLASPSIDGKTLLIIDPMIATGQSMITSLEVLKQRGTPKRIILVGLIASEQALAFLNEELDENIELYVATVDPELDEHNYIVPGLGDAGDLCYGEKL